MPNSGNPLRTRVERVKLERKHGGKKALCAKTLGEIHLGMSPRQAEVGSANLLMGACLGYYFFLNITRQIRELTRNKNPRRRADAGRPEVELLGTRGRGFGTRNRPEGGGASVPGAPCRAPEPPHAKRTGSKIGRAHV